MDVLDIKNLLDYIQKTNFSKVKIKINENFLSVEKGDKLYEVSEDAATITEDADKNLNEKTNDNIKVIKSPLVGTVHIDEKVRAGQRVSYGDTIAVIEAMKLMNEIESDCEGEIAEVCVEDGSVVGYADELLKIKIK